MNSKYIIELLDNKIHINEHFSCGIKPLNIYLKEKAGQEMRKKVTAVYILRETSNNKIFGYYTLSSFSIGLTDLPVSLIKKLPKYKALPVILLSRLAVDSASQHKGIGEYLLIDALSRSFELSKKIGAFAVIVDAKNDNIKSFYKKYGFIRTLHPSRTLYLPMKTIMQLIQKAV